MKIAKLKEFKNKKIAILGYGKEGISTLNFLKKLEFTNITILDKNINIRKQKDIKYHLGENYLNNLGVFDLIIKTPGISPYNDFLSIYREKITTQANIFFDNYIEKVIGITGTKGKSTTSTLIYKVLKDIGYNVKLVGNIGTPVLDEIDILNNQKYDFVVFELSSYMLELLKPKLYIGILNNLYDCHLDWHKGKDNYSNAKYNILKYSNFKLVNYELKNNTNTNNLVNLDYFGENGKYFYKNGLFYIGEQEIFKDINIALLGEHNRKNICAVIGVLNIIDKNNINNNTKILCDVLKKFTGLNHRIENIGVYKGIIFIDDAIATTPESTIAAIKTFGEKIGTILLGGQDSGFKFEQLLKTIKKYKIKNVVLFPDTGEKIFGDLSKYNYSKEFILGFGDLNINILKTKSMNEAIEFAYRKTDIGKICLLSNAAPSFSLWSGYIEKGEQFQNEVKKQALK